MIWTREEQSSRNLNIKVAEEAYEQNTASTYPEPEDKEAFIRTHLYDYNYDKVFSYIYFKSGMIPISDLKRN